MPIARAAAGASLHFDLAAGHLHATLAEGDDQLLGAGVIAHRHPVVAAFGTGAGAEPLADLLFQNIAAVGEFAGLAIDAGEDVLVDGFVEVEIFAGDAVEFPENAGLADAEDELLAVEIDEDTFEDFVEIEGLLLDVLEVPVELAGIGIEGEGGVGVEALVAEL